MSTLYVVATPIGNLEDIALRALRLLKEVALIATEDTRTTRKLLAHYQIRTHLTSYNEHNHKVKAPYILKVLEKADVALVSEAGTPTLSDPGRLLVQETLVAGHAVIPVPGPSAVTAALAASGLPADQFLFLGFLPARRGQRRRLLAQVQMERRTLVAFEVPHRLLPSLEDILQALGDRSIVVGREITKLHEEWFRGRVSEAQQRFPQPRGEFTLVIGGAEEALPRGSDAEALERLRSLRAEGVKAQEAVKKVALALNIPRHAVYRLWLSLK